MRRRITILSAVLSTLYLAVILWRHQPEYDLSRVDPKLRGLATPYQSVNVGLSGPFTGDIWLRILDRDGHQLRLALPASVPPGSAKAVYNRLILGAERPGDAHAVEVPMSEDTRQFLIDTIERHRRFSDSTDFVLLTLRGSPKDRAKYYARWASAIGKNALR